MSLRGEQQLAGHEYLTAVTTLLQRIRRTHPTSGLWEAADRQWSWRNTRATDSVPQLFWFADDGQPDAAVITTATEHGVGFDPMFMPDTAPDRVAEIIERGLAHAADCGFDTVEIEVDITDDVLRSVLFGRNFRAEDDGVVEAWLVADARPGISTLHADYRSSSRADTLDRPHHMISEARNHPDPEQRLRETSLYRADLDLVVHDANGAVAAYGLFWYDPTTLTGHVEPMRTEDDHQQRGLARHILTTGVNLLADAGATRIKIAFEPDNQAAGHLYQSVGFEPHRHTDVLSGPTH